MKNKSFFIIFFITILNIVFFVFNYKVIVKKDVNNINTGSIVNNTNTGAIVKNVSNSNTGKIENNTLSNNNNFDCKKIGDDLKLSLDEKKSNGINYIYKINNEILIEDSKKISFRIPNSFYITSKNILITDKYLFCSNSIKNNKISILYNFGNIQSNFGLTNNLVSGLLVNQKKLHMKLGKEEIIFLDFFNQILKKIDRNDSQILQYLNSEFTGDNEKILIYNKTEKTFNLYQNLSSDIKLESSFSNLKDYISYLSKSAFFKNNKDKFNESEIENIINNSLAINYNSFNEIYEKIKDKNNINNNEIGKYFTLIPNDNVDFIINFTK